MSERLYHDVLRGTGTCRRFSRTRDRPPASYGTAFPWRSDMSVLGDLRYALRLWKRYPTLVVVAGLSLGLGIGATTTMYSVVSRVTHYDLGFRDVDRMVIVWNAEPEKGINE